MNVCVELLSIVLIYGNDEFLVFYKWVVSPYTNIIK